MVPVLNSLDAAAHHDAQGEVALLARRTHQEASRFHTAQDVRDITTPDFALEPGLCCVVMQEAWHHAHEGVCQSGMCQHGFVLHRGTQAA